MDNSKGLRERIAYRLKLAREMAGLSQGQVAKMLTLQRPAISEIEAGRRRVSAEELTSFVQIYKVDISWLADTESKNMAQDKIRFAARELSKLDSENVDRLITVLSMLKKTQDDDQS